MRKMCLLIVICSLFITNVGLGQTKLFYIAEVGAQGYTKVVNAHYPHDNGYFIGGGSGLIFKEKLALSIEASGVYMPYNGDIAGEESTVWPPETPIEVKSDPSYAVDLDIALRFSDYRPLSMLRSNRDFYIKTGFGIRFVRRGELRKRYLRSDSSTYINVDKAEWGFPGLFIILGIGFEYRISDDLALHCELGPRMSINRHNPVPFTVRLGVGVRFNIT